MTFYHPLLNNNPFSMEHYEKSHVKKEFVENTEDVVRVSANGSLFGYVNFAKKRLEEESQSVTICGIGGAIGRAVSAAELLKKEQMLHQINTISFSELIEVWKPKEENSELQEIEVNRKIPSIRIVLSTTEPLQKGPGYQPPQQVSHEFESKPRQPKFKNHTKKPRDKGEYPFANNQKKREAEFKNEGNPASLQGVQGPDKKLQKKRPKKKPQNNANQAGENNPNQANYDPNNSAQNQPRQPNQAKRERPSNYTRREESFQPFFPNKDG